jgi:hypothetical protein
MKLSKPINQTAEVLYLLLKNKSITRKTAILDTGILNVSARIADLRNKYNINVICLKISTTNKFGRNINYGSWSILNHAEKYDIYKLINK